MAGCREVQRQRRLAPTHKERAQLGMECAHRARTRGGLRGERLSARAWLGGARVARRVRVTQPAVSWGAHQGAQGGTRVSPGLGGTAGVCACGIAKGASSRCARVRGREVVLPCCPPHSMAQAAACRFVEESGAAGSLEQRWEQHALRTPSPLLLRGAAWWWGVAMGSAPEAIDTVVSQGEEAAANYFCTSTDPEATPRLQPCTAAAGLERATRRASPGALAPTQRANLEHRV